MDRKRTSTNRMNGAQEYFFVRAFIAIELPEAVREKLGDLIVALRRESFRASWVRTGHMHLTLRFLGEVTDERLEVIDPSLRDACANTPSFTLEVRGLGAFPNLRRPSVLWVGVGPLEPALADLQRAAETAARNAGLAPESKPFHPHVTLARFKDPRAAGGLAGEVEARLDFGAGAFDVTHVSLFSSELTPRGPIYTRIREYPLK